MSRGQCETGRKGSRGHVMGDSRPLEPVELHSVPRRHRVPQQGMTCWVCILGCTLAAAISLAGKLSFYSFKKNTLVACSRRMPTRLPCLRR